MRRPRFPALALLIISMIVLFVAQPGVRSAAAQQTGTPAAATPAAAQPTQVAAPTAIPAAQAATPVAPAQTDVVTLVLWYSNPVDRDILELFPLQIGPGFVAGPQAGAQAVGTVDFPADGSPPTVTVGDTTFETYPRPDGVIERWTWFDDIEGARPGTLVMQLAGQGGTYQNYFGSATFVSRDEGGVGGVATIALRPPSATPAAGAEGSAPQAADEAAAAEPAVEPAAETADQPEATVEPGTEILEEPPVEPESAVAEGEPAG
jgi:hypothetical protein